MKTLVPTPPSSLVGRVGSVLLVLLSLKDSTSFAPHCRQSREATTFLYPSTQFRQLTTTLLLSGKWSSSSSHAHNDDDVGKKRDLAAFPSKINHDDDDDDDDLDLRADENLLRASEFLLDDDYDDLHDRASATRSNVRRLRLEREVGAKRRYARHGDELWTLRADMSRLSEELFDAQSAGDRDHVDSVRRQLLRAEKRDPELVYRLEMEEMMQAKMDDDLDRARRHKEEALAARSCLPHLNLEGLWVGKYGSHGYEMINVTYVGDTLIAFKVTGDKNVPKGEITFQANLAPKNSVSAVKGAELLKPIVLTEAAAKKWGTKQLPRYAGLGHVAEEGFANNQWMDGQLIIIGDEYFSFAWLPIGHQIFFGRPSPELSLKMLREEGMTSVQVGSAPPTIYDDVSAMKEYAARCLEVTTEFIEDDVMEGKADPFSCIWSGESTEECFFE